MEVVSTDSLLEQVIEASGNEFSMGYDDSNCFWRFYYGNRGAGSMMDGWPSFNSESADVREALQEFLQTLIQPQTTEEGTTL